MAQLGYLTHFDIPTTHCWMLTDVLRPLHEDNINYQYKHPVVHTAIKVKELIVTPLDSLHKQLTSNTVCG